MSQFRFPFNWGSVPDVVPSVTTPVVPVTGTRWTALAATSKGWIEGISTPHRFERVYTQPRGVFGQSINFSFHVSSQFPFIVKTGNQVYISSTITNP